MTQLDGVEAPKQQRRSHSVNDQVESRAGDADTSHRVAAHKAADRLSQNAWEPEQTRGTTRRSAGHESPFVQAAEKSETRAPLSRAAAVGETRLSAQDSIHKLVEKSIFKLAPGASLAAVPEVPHHERARGERVQTPSSPLFVQAVEQGQGERQLQAPTARQIQPAEALRLAQADGRQVQPGDGRTVQPGDGRQLQPTDGRQQPTERTARDVNTAPVKDIEVRYAGTFPAPGEVNPPADFRVKRDGTVEVLRNPDSNSNQRLVVEVDRPAGAAGRGAPPPEQQRAVNELVNYLSSRYMKQETSRDGSPIRDGRIQDNQGLVSDQVKRAARTEPTGVDQLPAPIRQQIEHINRHGGRGQFTPRQAAEDFAPRTVPRQRGETDKMAALKDVGSGFLHRGDKDPYHAVQNWPEQGHRVGRYGISADQFRNWVKGLSPSEIQQLVKEGKLPADERQLNDFLDKMKSGQGNIDKAEIDKFLPKELQERIGTDLVKHYALATAIKDENGRPAAVDVGKVALSMVLGHAVTDAEANGPQGKAIRDAAMKQYALAVMHEQNPSNAIDMSNAGGKIAGVARADLGRALWTRHANVVQGGRLGCASSVSKVLQEAGVSNVNDASVVGMADKLRSQGWQALPFNQRRPGDVIIAQGGVSRGHTGIVGENPNITYNNHSSSGRWSADQANYWTKWNRVYVLRAPGTA